MKPEQLVPPLELCKKIPEGKFAESALVWEEDSCVLGKLPPHVVPRKENTYHTILAPAPTLAEITEALYKEAEGCCPIVNCFYDKEGWDVVADYECHDDSGYGSSYVQMKDLNPATAALKLWLEVNK